jgi:hypothetical protein
MHYHLYSQLEKSNEQESLSSDGQQYHQYQQNEQAPVISHH